MKKVFFVNLPAEMLMVMLCETGAVYDDSECWNLYSDLERRITKDNPEQDSVYVTACIDHAEEGVTLQISQGVSINTFWYERNKPLWNFLMDNYGWKKYVYWNGTTETIISPDEIEGLFSEQCHKKNFIRIPYDTQWCKIFRNKDIKHLHLYYVSSTQTIKVITRDIDLNAYDEFDFKMGDNSFGQFLYAEYFREFAESKEKDIFLAKSKAEVAAKKKFDEMVENEITCQESTAYATISSDPVPLLINSASTNDYNKILNELETNKILINTCGSEAYSLTDTLNDLKAQVGDLTNKFIEFKEKKDMTVYKDNTVKNTNSLAKTFNLDIGTCENDNVKMSPYGLAIKNTNGTWVSYDAKTGSIMDVEILNFDCGKYLFKMPVAVDQIKTGDVIVHNRTPVFVKSAKSGQIEAVDIYTGSVQVIIPTKNMFNFNFVTKVVSLVDFTGATASAENPFGNMLPLMLMSEGNNDLLPLMFMSGNTGLDMSNPLMMYALCGKDSKMADILPMMLLSQSMSGAKTPTAAN
jgi:hypothetical protein